MTHAAYSLDNRLIPGEVVIAVEGHRPYIAGTMHTAELFAQQIGSDASIALPAQTESTQLDELHATVARILRQIAVEGVAQALIETRHTIEQHVEMREAVLP
jgi:hypothetical protein